MGKDGHFLPSKPNPWDQYQDYGHSHWYDSFVVADGVVNVTLTGEGILDGGKLSTGQPKATGGGCRLIAMRSCAAVTIEGLTTRNAGWFTLLATNVSGLVLQDLRVHATRDAFDLVSCRNVLVQRVDISGGGDDAVVLKSDYSLGAALDSYNVVVRDSVIGSDGCNALQFGSETVGDFFNITFTNLTLTAAGKAGIGIVSMDGSQIHDVTYSDITMSHTVTPLYLYIGARLRRPAPATVGGMHNLLFRNITATDCLGDRGTWAATLDGQPADLTANVSRLHAVGPNITFDSMDFSRCFHGGGNVSDASIEPPHPADSYPPRYLGTRPAYGLYIRNAMGVTFDGLRIGNQAASKPEGRPAVVVEDSSPVTFQQLSAQRDSEAGSTYDVGLRRGAEGTRVSDSPGILVRNLTCDG